MALITKISSILSDFKCKIRPNQINSGNMAEITKKQTLGYAITKDIADTDIIEISGDISQEIIKDISEDEENSSLNIIA